MDRSWMQTEGMGGRRQEVYRKGVQEFLNFAFKDSNLSVKLLCPCRHCQNHFSCTQETMKVHLMRNGIEPSYNPWIYHGEELPDPVDEEMYEADNDFAGEEDSLISSDDIATLVHEATNVPPLSGFSLDSEGETPHIPSQDGEGTPNDLPDSFHRLMKSAKEELYPGCKNFSKLEFIVTLLHLKVSGRWSEKSFSGLLSALHKAFNFDPNFPKSSHEAKKYTKDLGLNYVKIHACVNHCILYRKEHANAEVCPMCNEPRWQEDVAPVDDSGTFTESQGTQPQRSRIPRLVLRYFPVTPRLQRLYMSPKLAGHMRWHMKCKNGDTMRHPADSMAWKKFDEKFSDFAADPRNVRLGLAADGFTPITHAGTKYSIWPVFLVPYNLPPLMCMRSPYIMLSLLIPGPESPGNDIDVFLEPLIDELKDLWENGAETYDAHSGKRFTMKAALLWTISDFPAYGNLSGWSTCGKLACPSCHKDTEHVRLDHWGKECFLGHRRFLDPDHRWRHDNRNFNGKKERRPPPVPLSGDEVLETLSGFPKTKFGKSDSRKRKRDPGYLIHQFKKESGFFKLPYWRHLLIRHNLDIMHIEKNVCDNILGTILGIPGKNKDGLNARLDLVKLNMHKKLQATKVGDKYSFPLAPYQLTLEEKRKVSNFLSKVKVPDGHSSNIARCASLRDGRITDMKSHDSHIFMQELLVPAFRGILPTEVLKPLAELSLFFRQLSSKALTLDILKKLDKSIAVTLCKLERIFVPAFFDISVHLPIHLAKEAMLGGPVQSRSMWRYEREMRALKSYVGNKAHPEASIAEAHIENECLTFCSRYLNDVESKFDRSDRNFVDAEEGLPFKLSIFQKKGSPLGKRSFKQLSHVDWKKAHLYGLTNCPEVEPFIKEYESLHERGQDFVDWFRSLIWKLYKEQDPRATKELLSLSRGPSKSYMSYQGYLVNGYRFHTKKRQRKRKTQNSGVVVKGDEKSDQKDFFGVLKEVLELEYDAPESGQQCPVVVVFRCYWFDVFGHGLGMRKDEFDTTSINIKRKLKTDEPFAMASQVSQVYYVKSHNEPNWRIVIRTIPRNFYYSPIESADNCEEEEDVGFNEDIDFHVAADPFEDHIPLPRSEVPAIVEADPKAGRKIVQTEFDEEDELSDNWDDAMEDGFLDEEEFDSSESDDNEFDSSDSEVGSDTCI